MEELKELVLAKNDNNTTELPVVTDVNFVGVTLLEQNKPNPFNQSTSISYELPQNFGAASLVIYNDNGQLLKQIDLDHSGKGVVNIDAFELPAGQYRYSLNVDGRVIDTKTMVLTK